MRMGIIAEDDSDVSVIRELTLSLLKPKRVRFKSFVGNGCGKLRRKCAAWANNLVRQGCPWIAVVHDLDIYREQELRAELINAIAPANPRAIVVLIPKREIEAWLLYDTRAIASAFNETEPLQLPGNPESLRDPKKHLRKIIWRKYRKHYLNTVHNGLIAKYINVFLLNRSASFRPHPNFIRIVKAGIR